MSTRTTGKRERLVERINKRIVRNNQCFVDEEMHIRAEYALLARQIKQLNRFAPGPVKGCHCQICSVHSHTLGAYLNRNDVLALLKQAKRQGGSMKAINEPSKLIVEFVGGPKALVMTKALMRNLFKLAKDNKIRRVLVVLEK